MRNGPRAPCLCLSHVRLRDLANGEALLGCLEVLGQDVDVILAQLDDRLIADDVHVELDSFQQYFLLDVAELLGARARIGFGTYLRAGVPVTLATLAIGTLALALAPR